MLHAATFSPATRPRAYRARAPRSYPPLRSSTDQAAGSRRRKAIPRSLHWPRSMTPPGRNSSASPDGVAVNRGAVAKMFIPLQWEHLLSPGVSRAVDSKRELYVAHIVLDGIRLHFETEAPAHFQHHHILLKDIPRDSFEPFGLRVFDDQLHQRPAQPPALEIGSEQDRVFTALVDRIRVDLDQANHLVGGFIERDESHRAGVVELGQPRDERVGKLLHRREEPQP